MNAGIVSSSDAETLNVLGMPHAILRQGSGYEVFDITGPEGLGVPPHVHKNEDETFYVVSGRAHFQVDDRDAEVGPGTAINLPRGVPHSFRIIAPDTRLLLTVCPGQLSSMFRELAAMPPGEPDLAEIGRICGGFDIAFV